MSEGADLARQHFFEPRLVGQGQLASGDDVAVDLRQQRAQASAGGEVDFCIEGVEASDVHLLLRRFGGYAINAAAAIDDGWSGTGAAVPSTFVDAVQPLFCPDVQDLSCRLSGRKPGDVGGNRVNNLERLNLLGLIVFI